MITKSNWIKGTFSMWMEIYNEYILDFCTLSWEPGKSGFKNYAFAADYGVIIDFEIQFEAQTLEKAVVIADGYLDKHIRLRVFS